MIIVDIWGGELSQDHVARYVLSVDEAMQLARSELSDGYLVNLRNEIAWGTFIPFDTRLS